MYRRQPGDQSHADRRKTRRIERRGIEGGAEARCVGARTEGPVAPQSEGRSVSTPPPWDDRWSKDIADSGPPLFNPYYLDIEAGLSRKEFDVIKLFLMRLHAALKRASKALGNS